MRHLRTTSLLIVLALSTLTGVAGAAPAADDLSITVQLGRRGPQGVGGTLDTKTSGLRFLLVIGVDTTVGAPQQVTVRLTLPEGLHWGDDAPDPAEGCTTAAQTECTAAIEPNPAGTTGAGWYWDVVADRPGVYEITSTVSGSEPDPDLSNNTKSFRFEVVRPTSGGSGGGSGSSASVSAGAVKLSPVKPKAGSTVVASVRVTRDGSRVKPTGIACSASLGGAKVKGGAKSSSGLASCLFKTPRSGKGKTMLGSVSFTAGGQSFTKRFSAKLG